ncbi:MAG: hypothetical protein VB102_02030 [Paludibacter sp.]|nr:hypothetical protein [Paludibacter sp.]
MQEIITPLNKADLQISKKQSKDCKTSMQPSETTVQRILQFAANYRVQKISENQFIEMNLS